MRTKGKLFKGGLKAGQLDGYPPVQKLVRYNITEIGRE